MNNFIGVSPYAGAYPNNGSASGGQPGTFDGFHYVATTSTIDQKITGYLAINATPPTFSHADRGACHGDRPGDQRDLGRQRHLAGRMRRLHPLRACRLVPISPKGRTPALYLNTANGVQLGLLTAASGDDRRGQLAAAADRRDNRARVGLGAADRLRQRPRP